MLTMIRRYRDKDSEALIEIWYTASQVATPFPSEGFLAEEREAIRKSYLPRAETWVFETEGTVAGFITLLGYEVGAIFVHPKWQRHGVGRALIDHAIDLRSFLYLDVFKENAVGRRFYNRYGFQSEHEHVHAQTGHIQMRFYLTAIFRPDLRTNILRTTH